MHKRLAFLMLAVCACFLVLGAATAGTVSIADLLNHASAYDGSHVVVAGSVASVRPKTSRAGNQYETFDLCDTNGNCVRVFTWGQPALREGDKITVKGTFSAAKHVGGYAFRNEIEADEGSL